MGQFWQAFLLLTGVISLFMWTSDLKTPGQEGGAATAIVMACLAFGGAVAIGLRRRSSKTNRTKSILATAAILIGSLAVGLVVGLVPVIRTQSLVGETSVQLLGNLSGKDFLIEQPAFVRSDDYRQTSVGVNVSNLGENNNRTPNMEIAIDMRGSDPVKCESFKGHTWWGGTGDTMEETLYCDDFIPRSDFQLIESVRITAE